MKLNVSITVDRPAEEVFDAMLDARNEVTWNTEVSRATLDSAEPVGLGSRFTAVNRGRPSKAEITAYDRPRAGTFSVTGSGMDITCDLTFTPVGESTKVDGNFDFEGRGAMKLVLPLVGPSIRKDMPKQFANFKRFCESGKAQG